MRKARDNHLIDVCRLTLLYVPYLQDARLYGRRCHYTNVSQILSYTRRLQNGGSIAVSIFINEQGTAPKDGMNFNSLRVGSELT